MKRIIIIICVIVISSPLFSQEKIFSTNTTYFVNNHELGKYFSEFIEHEKQYDYFGSDCLFNIQMTKIDSTINILLISGSPIEKIRDWSFWDQINDKYFIIKYYDYYFLLFCPNGEIDIDSELLIKRKEFTSFKVHFDKEKDIIHKEINYSFTNINDDTYWETVWMIAYHQRLFYENSRIARNYGRKK